MSEWKTLLHQIIVAFQSGQVEIQDGTERRKRELLQRVERQISPIRSTLYSTGLRHYAGSLHTHRQRSDRPVASARICGRNHCRPEEIRLRWRRHSGISSGEIWNTLIMLWNGVPVRLSYQDDIPAMASTLIKMLQSVRRSEAASGTSYTFITPNIDARWKVETDSEMITIEGHWRHVPGRYEASLNQLGIIRMPRAALLCEWKLLLQQLIKAISRCGGCSDYA